MPSRGEIMLRRSYVFLFLLVASSGYFAEQADAMYAPDIGRFISRDPIGFEGSPWNLYEFLSANPGNQLDPSGKATCGGGVVVGGAAAANPAAATTVAVAGVAAIGGTIAMKHLLCYRGFLKCIGRASQSAKRCCYTNGKNSHLNPNEKSECFYYFYGRNLLLCSFAYDTCKRGKMFRRYFPPGFKCHRFDDDEDDDDGGDDRPTRPPEEPVSNEPDVPAIAT